MRILVCASEAPLAPLNGARLVLRELCAHLAVQHEVTVVALRRPGQYGNTPAGVELIALDFPEAAPREAWAARWLALVRREPVEVRRLARPFADALPALLERRRFDVAHVTLGPLATIAPYLRDLPAVIAPLDAWHLNVRAEVAQARGLEYAWRRAQEAATRRFEARAYRPFRRVVFVTEQDAREVARLDHSLRVCAIPSGVDAEAFAPPPATARTGERIVFTGAFEAPSNQQAAMRLARHILPRVRARVPGARLELVGRSPTAAVRSLARLDGVRVVGEVPDLRPWLWEAPAYACPMVSGTGIKNKLLEAMAAGAPAVVTPLACQGLTVRDGEHVLVADDDEALAQRLVALLIDRALGARLGAAARAYVRERHDWDAVAAAHQAIYEEIVFDRVGA